MAKNEENWLANYEALKAYVLETGHFPNKHDKRLNWEKFQMKKIKAGTLDPERQRLFEELVAMRSGEHMGGRRKALHNPYCLRQASQGPSATGSGQV